MSIVRDVFFLSLLTPAGRTEVATVKFITEVVNNTFRHVEWSVIGRQLMQM